VDTGEPIKPTISSASGEARLPFEPEMIVIPSGEFLMGSDPEKDRHAGEDERPQHTLFLPEYAMAKTPVTNTQYAAFLKATGHTPPAHWKILFWRKRWPPRGRQDYPVVNVSWYDAKSYCRWLSKATGKTYRLPSEAEWEKAARGTDGRVYPWGDVWETERCNISENVERDDTTPVGIYPGGASPYGLLDMVGNIWEWTRSLWGRNLREPQFKYPYDPTDGREDIEAKTDMRRVLRGVSFLNDRQVARCASRYRYSPSNFFATVGFRVALFPVSGSQPTAS
jgi:formylglycine-generating enzyme required for sulfatase activity